MHEYPFDAGHLWHGETVDIQIVINIFNLLSIGGIILLLRFFWHSGYGNQAFAWKVYADRF